MTEAGRPPRGLLPEAALKHWSDPAAYTAMEEFADAADPKSGIKSYEERHREYQRRREPLEEAFIKQLEAGSVLGSGIGPGSDGRIVIRPSLWRVLNIRYDFDDAGGGYRSFDELEFFSPSAIPLNIEEIPAWVRPADDGGFRHDATYREIELEGMIFRPSKLRARIIMLLHRAAVAGTPWRVGKQILSEAGTDQTKMHDVFRPWSAWTPLIESDGTGSYRLRLRGSSLQDPLRARPQGEKHKK